MEETVTISLASHLQLLEDSKRYHDDNIYIVTNNGNVTISSKTHKDMTNKILKVVRRNQVADALTHNRLKEYVISLSNTTKLMVEQNVQYDLAWYDTFILSNRLKELKKENNVENLIIELMGCSYESIQKRIVNAGHRTIKKINSLLENLFKG